MRLCALILVLCTAATAQEQSRRERRATPRTAEQPVVRILQLPNGSFLRYEVDPEDAAEPPGELVVMHFDAQPPVQARRAEPPTEQAPPAPPARRNTQRRAGCDQLRDRLAARLLELRGLSVEPDLAGFIQRNLYFAGGYARPLQIAPDPLFLDALRTDLAARTLAQELASCERR
jgi:hypothetical protein